MSKKPSSKQTSAKRSIPKKEDVDFAEKSNSRSELFLLDKLMLPRGDANENTISGTRRSPIKTKTKKPKQG